MSDLALGFLGFLAGIGIGALLIGYVAWSDEKYWLELQRRRPYIHKD